MNEQKSRRRIGGSLGRRDYTVSGNHAYAAGNNFGISIQLGRQGHHDGHDYDHYVQDYLHHDYGHHYTALGHSLGGFHYPSYTYRYSSYSSPYYSGRHGFGFGSSLGGLSFGYSDYSYGYPSYYCSSGYDPSYYNSSAVGYTPYDYDHLGYPTVSAPVAYPIYVDEYLEPVILDEDDGQDAVLDEAVYDPFNVGFYYPFGLSQNLSGYWLEDYTYAWPSWGWCRTFTLDPTAELFYSGAHVLY